MQGMQDALPDHENDDIDRAIALSLSEEEHKKAKATGKIYSSSMSNTNISCYIITY